MFEMIFSCRCGKQLFGDQIEAEYVRQQAEFEATKHTKKVERALPKPPPPASPTPRPTVTVASAPGPEEGWTESANEEKSAASDASSCEWHICNNPPRPNSKYCSRDCSNKNARLRYKKRKNADKAAA
jgi:hypothetical protein